MLYQSQLSFLKDVINYPFVSNLIIAPWYFKRYFLTLSFRSQPPRGIKAVQRMMSVQKKSKGQVLRPKPHLPKQVPLEPKQAPRVNLNKRYIFWPYYISFFTFVIILFKGSGLGLKGVFNYPIIGNLNIAQC